MFTVVSLFSGSGGMDLGFIQAGFKIIFANDFNKDACITYRHNIGDHIQEGPIESIPISEIPDNPDVVIGGVPCQGFSVSNLRRYIDDPRNYLYKYMVEIIKAKKPTFFVLENVPGMLSLGNGIVFKQIIEDFQEIGYYVEYKKLDASHFDVPQKRIRLFIIGTNHPQAKIRFPKPNKNNIITVQQAIGFLENVPCRDKCMYINHRVV